MEAYCFIFVLIISNTITSELIETFRYNYWEEQFPRTWITTHCKFNMDYYKISSLQKYGHRKSLQFKDAQLQLVARHPLNGVNSVATIDSSQEFLFQYGEIEWTAKILLSNNVLNIFRVGEWYRGSELPDNTYNFDGTKPGIELVVQKDQNNTDGTIIIPRLYHSNSRVNSSDWSSLLTKKISSEDLSANFNRFKLKWTKTELVWMINNTAIYRLTDKFQNIPNKNLSIGVYLVAGPDFTGEQFMLLDSIVVKESEASPQEYLTPQFGNRLHLKLNEITSVKSLDWRIYNGTVKYGAENPGDMISIYSPDCVQVKNGILKILTGQYIESDGRVVYKIGRVDSIGNFSFLYGEVEWQMVVTRVKGIRFYLELTQNLCQTPTYGGDECLFSSGQTVNFFDMNNGQLRAILLYPDASRSDRATVFDQKNYKTYNKFIKDNTTSQSHKYRIFWTRYLLIWYIDDVEVDRVTDLKQIPSKPMYISMKTQVFDEPQYPAGFKKENDTMVIMEVESITLHRHVNLTRNCDKNQDQLHEDISVIKVKAGSIPDLIDNCTIHNSKSGAALIVSIVVPVLGLTLGIIIGVTLYIVVKRRSLKGTMRRCAFSLEMENLSKLLQTDGIHLSDNVLLNYTNLLIVSRKTVDISDEILGRGQFGIVFKGLAHHLPAIIRGPTVVAIKTPITFNSNTEQQRLFNDELRIMVKLGRHVNIVNLLGLVLDEGLPLLLLEYCQFGSLLDFLHNHRDLGLVYIHVDEEGTLLPLNESEMRKYWFRACQGKNLHLENEIMKDHMLSTEALIKFSHQISRGMEFLSSRSVIHRDLAARNILVADGHILKICDFGLSKSGEMTYTMSHTMIPIPILWMPPDSILERTFSSKSDVWSFGIVLWEVFSLGQKPFDTPDVAKFTATAFASWLAEGRQMARPEGAPLEIYELMQNCWELNAENRWTFAQFQEKLERLICDVSRSNSIRYLSLQDYYSEFNGMHEALIDKND